MYVRTYTQQQKPQLFHIVANLSRLRMKLCTIEAKYDGNNHPLPSHSSPQFPQSQLQLSIALFRIPPPQSLEQGKGGGELLGGNG